MSTRHMLMSRTSGVWRVPSITSGLLLNVLQQTRLSKEGQRTLVSGAGGSPFQPEGTSAALGLVWVGLKMPWRVRLREPLRGHQLSGEQTWGGWGGGLTDQADFCFQCAFRFCCTKTMTKNKENRKIETASNFTIRTASNIHYLLNGCCAVTFYYHVYCLVAVESCVKPNSSQSL